MRVPLADEGPVREPEIGQPRITEGRADAVHVASCALRIHERQEVTASMPAAYGEVLICFQEGVGLLLVVEHGVEGEKRVELRAVKACDRGARANAARVPRD